MQQIILSTKNDPIYQKNFRYLYHLKTEIQRQVQKLITPLYITLFKSDLDSTKKLDALNKKKWRLVIDFRKLN